MEFLQDDNRPLTPSEQQLLIRQVQGDTSKSSNEKNMMIRQIMQRKIQAEPIKKEECKHYVKKCSNFYFECCNTYDSCHRCHAEYNDCNKRDIKTITCMECNVTQGISNECVNCKITFSNSFCSICKIWTSLEIYHCDGCGICRVGNGKNYIHCDKCNGCFSASSEHTCEFFKPLDQLECLVCMESAHTSQKAILPLPCGHGKRILIYWWPIL